MSNIYFKYQQAMEVAGADPAIKKAHPKYQLMGRERLYAVLIGHGYRWDSVTQQWAPRQTLTINEVPTEKRMQAAVPRLNNVFLVRIMAPANEISKVQAEFLELSEACWRVREHKDKDYANEPDGSWVRRYYTVKRGK